MKAKLVIINNNLTLLSKLISVTNAKYERQSNIPYPVPEDTVKKIIDLLGCIFNYFFPAVKSNLLILCY